MICPGLAHRMSAGTGILHGEKNDSWRLAGQAHSELLVPPGLIRYSNLTPS